VGAGAVREMEVLRIRIANRQLERQLQRQGHPFDVRIAFLRRQTTRSSNRLPARARLVMASPWPTYAFRSQAFNHVAVAIPIVAAQPSARIHRVLTR